jgi:Voltage-dependent anion channel
VPPGQCRWTPATVADATRSLGPWEDVGTVETGVGQSGAATMTRQGRLADLFPGYFALVMATGIIAVGAFQQRILWLAWTLLWADVAFYLALWVLYLIRLVRYRARFLADLTSHQRGPAFLTMVAGTNVLGSGLVLIAGWSGVGFGLWILGIVLWTTLFYAVTPVRAILRPPPAGRRRPPGRPGWSVPASRGRPAPPTRRHGPRRPAPSGRGRRAGCSAPG